MNRGTAIAALALMVSGFTAGWWANGLRMDNKLKGQQITTLNRDAQRAQSTINTINTKLGEVVTKGQMAADNTQAALQAIADIRQQANVAKEQVTHETMRLDNEIAKLGIPKCQFDFTYGELWRTTGERANATRRALYGPESKPSN